MSVTVLCIDGPAKGNVYKVHGQAFQMVEQVTLPSIFDPRHDPPMDVSASIVTYYVHRALVFERYMNLASVSGTSPDPMDTIKAVFTRKARKVIEK